MTRFFVFRLQFIRSSISKTGVWVKWDNEKNGLELTVKIESAKEIFIRTFLNFLIEFTPVQKPAQREDFPPIWNWIDFWIDTSCSRIQAEKNGVWKEKQNVLLSYKVNKRWRIFFTFDCLCCCNSKVSCGCESMSKLQEHSRPSVEMLIKLWAFCVPTTLMQ